MSRVRIPFPLHSPRSQSDFGVLQARASRHHATFPATYPHTVDALAAPYPPSWYDRLQDWIERRTGLGWGFWVIAEIAIAVAVNGLAWLVGYVPVGVVDPYVTSGEPYLVIGYGGMHYLDSAAGRAWRAFRPSTVLDDADAARSPTS